MTLDSASEWLQQNKKVSPTPNPCNAQTVRIKTKDLMQAARASHTGLSRFPTPHFLIVIVLSRTFLAQLSAYIYSHKQAKEKLKML